MTFGVSGCSSKYAFACFFGMRSSSIFDPFSGVECTIFEAVFDSFVQKSAFVKFIVAGDTIKLFENRSTFFDSIFSEILSKNLKVFSLFSDSIMNNESCNDVC